jgi:tripartite-type tricarboxylate transporter receptor subunit TctC
VASLPEMFAGEIDFQFIDSTAGTGLLQSGKVRGLAVTSGQRVPGVDLPTMAEAAGIAEFDIAPVWGVLLPAGAPPAIVAQLETWFGQISQMEVTRKYIASTHAAPFPGNAKALADFLPKEIKKWEELSKLAKIVPQ